VRGVRVRAIDLFNNLRCILRNRMIKESAETGMSKFVRIGSRSELPKPGEAREFTLGDKAICVANVNGALAAMDNVCLHRGAPLGQGSVEHGKLICPWHGWRWDPVTGAATENPSLKLAIYRIKVEGDDVLVQISARSGGTMTRLERSGRHAASGYRRT
jgi:nitrite reductase (NADH) small subunit